MNTLTLQIKIVIVHFFLNPRAFCPRVCLYTVDGICVYRHRYDSSNVLNRHCLDFPPIISAHFRFVPIHGQQSLCVNTIHLWSMHEICLLGTSLTLGCSQTNQTAAAAAARQVIKSPDLNDRFRRCCVNQLNKMVLTANQSAKTTLLAGLVS